MRVLSFPARLANNFTLSASLVSIAMVGDYHTYIEDGDDNIFAALDRWLVWVLELLDGFNIDKLSFLQ